jgi:hypothetical protein
VKNLTREWLKDVSWETVVAINAALCQNKRALHKPTSDGYEPAQRLWEQNRHRKMSLQELLNICFKCHRLAPFCNYNGNTYVTVVKTLLDDILSEMPPDKAFILRNIAGHIVAGTATDIETKQLDSMLRELEK